MAKYICTFQLSTLIDAPVMQADLAAPAHSLRTPGYPVDIISIHNAVLLAAQFTLHNATTAPQAHGTILATLALANSLVGKLTSFIRSPSMMNTSTC
jgi:hypothetical protein